MTEYKEAGSTTTKYDLSGGKFGDFSAPTKSIDVFLAGKRYQIINVTGRPLDGIHHTQTDFLFVDPEVFNRDDVSPRGYAWLPEGREVRIGRSYPYNRISYSSYVSRDHASIKVGKGKILIRDLNSRNGTVVEVPLEEVVVGQRVSAQYTKEESWNIASREVFEIAGRRTSEQIRRLISEVREVLINDENLGQNKLGRTIEETRTSRFGSTKFTDGKIVYLPARGRAVFIGDTHGDSLATESILTKSFHFIENMVLKIFFWFS